jgi:hypothetical protein
MSICARKLILPLFLALACFASPAGAVGFETFGCITSNDVGDCSIGEAALSMTIVESGGEALLTVTMTGSDPAVVEQVFIESEFVSAISFAGSVGAGVVGFSSGVTGGNLPGGNPLDFTEAVNTSAFSQAPLWGIGAHPQDQVSGQSGTFLLSYSGATFEELVAELRIGVHMIGYASGGSESFVSVPLPLPIPEPSTFAMLLSGLFGLAVLRR